MIRDDTHCASATGTASILDNQLLRNETFLQVNEMIPIKAGNFALLDL